MTLYVKQPWCNKCAAKKITMLYSPDEGWEGVWLNYRTLTSILPPVTPSNCQILEAVGRKEGRSASPEPALLSTPGPSLPRWRDGPAPSRISPDGYLSLSLSQKGKNGQRHFIYRVSIEAGGPSGSLDSNLHSNSPKILVSKPPALPLGSAPPY